MFRQTFMRRTCTITLLSLTVLHSSNSQHRAAKGDPDREFDSTVRPFLAAYCTGCHSGSKAMAQLDLQRFTTVASIVEDHPHWSTVLQKLSAGQMPPSRGEAAVCGGTRSRCDLGGYPAQTGGA